MRRPLIAGNWKMYLRRGQAVELARQVVEQVDGQLVDVAICPPAVYLDAVGQVLDKSAVALGAQNMYHQAEGAFTGEISPAMLADLRCRYVILGHSERRHLLGETDEDVYRKVQAALEHGLTPIVCLGETLQERELSETRQVIRRQFDGSLGELNAEQALKVVIAYEPVWAIGTGQVATPEQAEEVHADLRRILETRYNTEVASQIRIQYGGSVKPDNAGQLLAQANIDGALVGGASLKAESFLGIVAAARSSQEESSTRN